MTKERMKRAKGQQGEVQKTVPLKEYRKKEVQKIIQSEFSDTSRVWICCTFHITEYLCSHI